MKKSHLILAIDDDSSILDDLEDTIRSMGHRCIKAQNAEDAWSLLQKQQPCLVLLDLELKTDRRSAKARISVGFNMLDRVRSKFERATLPVILITAHAQEQNDLAIRGLRGKCDDFVKKPFTDGTLEQRIAAQLAQCKSHATPAIGPKPPADAKAGDRLRFIGRGNSRRRHLLLVNGQEAWVRAASFELLWRLALPLWKGTRGWLKAAQLGMDGNVHQAIKRARDDIARHVKDPKATIENNGYQYRLSTAPACVEYDADAVREYFSHLLELIEPSADAA